MQHSDAATREALRRIIEQGDIDGMQVVQAAIEACGSLAYSRQRATQYAQDAEAALAVLPEGEYRAALHGLARYSVSRDH